MRLEKEVAIVTGAASGIGRASAILLAQEGATVVVADIQRESRLDEETPDTVTVIEEAGGSATFVETDVASSAAVQHLVDTTLETYGRLDILVNSAGIFVRNPITEVSDEEWDRVLDINLRGYFYTCRAVIPHMLEAGAGRIVNISSIHGFRGTGTATTYCTSKGGVENLTKQLAVECAPHNVRVNAIAPGTIRTAMCKPFLEKPEIRAEYERRTLLPRLGVPEDVAHAVLYLASHESSYVVGHTLVIDGGWTIT